MTKTHVIKIHDVFLTNLFTKYKVLGSQKFRKLGTRKTENIVTRKLPRTNILSGFFLRN